MSYFHYRKTWEGKKTKKIIAINGSHRKGRNTAILLQTVLDQLKADGMQTELIELSELNIEFCRNCNKCLKRSECVIKDDDMDWLAQKIIKADAVILGSPVYWRNVTARMKNFMDRTRYLHIYKNLLYGKVGAAVTHAGLRNGGQEMCLMLLESFLSHQGLLLANTWQSRDEAIDGPMGTLQKSSNKAEIVWYRDIREDEITLEACKRLGKNISHLLKHTSLKSN